MSFNSTILEIVDQYRTDTGATGPVDPHDIAEYAYARRLYLPNPKTVIDAIASNIAQVFREEYRIDPQGRRYRAKHAATERRGNKTIALWADMDDPDAPHAHFQKSFAQRRNHIVNECVQLKTDADVYNDKRQPVEPIQIPLDFTYDVEELQLRQPRKAA